MYATLTVQNGTQKGRELSVRHRSFLIGSGAVCRLRLRNKKVCPRHCILLVRGGRLSIHDLACQSGTFVNDCRITGTTELQCGDRIRVGASEFVINWEPEWLRSTCDNDQCVCQVENDTAIEPRVQLPEKPRIVGVPRSRIDDLTAANPSDAAAGALDHLFRRR